MGIIQCEIYGRQSIVPVCPEIAEGLRRSVPLRRRAGLIVLVCDDCWERHDLGRFDSEVFPDWSDEAFAQFESLESEAYCRECLAASDLAMARAQGLPDPFPAYEKILTFLQQPAVDQLTTILLQGFDFQRSVVPRKASLRCRLWLGH